MADAKRRARLGAAIRGTQPGEPPAVSAPENELDDVEKQAAILEPKPMIVTVAGKPIDLYILPAKVARRFKGFMRTIFVGTIGAKGPASLRIHGEITQSAELTTTFAGFVARASFAPSSTPEQLANLENIARHIDDNATEEEFGALILQMIDITYPPGEFSGPN